MDNLVWPTFDYPRKIQFAVCLEVTYQDIQLHIA